MRGSTLALLYHIQFHIPTVILYKNIEWTVNMSMNPRKILGGFDLYVKYRENCRKMLTFEILCVTILLQENS